MAAILQSSERVYVGESAITNKHTSNNTCIANIINHIHHGDQGIHEINHKTQLIEKNKLDCINFENRITLQPLVP